LAAVLVVRFTLFVPFRVPSASMWPVVGPGEHVFSNATDKKPLRGAVMVFRYPENPEQLFIKRVMATAGDEIEVKAGRPTINGFEVPHCKVGKAGYTDEDSLPTTIKGDLEVEWLDDAVYLVLLDSRGGFGDGTWTVKPGEYFVMGDNRDNAHDSRMWFGGSGGGVPFANTQGRLRLDPQHPRLPKGAESLAPELASCLAKKPAVTSPPNR
jgi:signal peptidase I